jgi:fatty-acyl-CoA synthase
MSKEVHSLVSNEFRPYVADILDLLATRPDSEVVVHEERRITAADFTALVRRLAHALQDCGAGPRSTVTLLTSNRPETIAVRYAANLIGCRVNHLYSGLSAILQASIINDVETCVLVVDPEHAERAAELKDATPALTVVALGVVAGVEIDLLHLAQDLPDEPVRCLAGPDDIAIVRHTGGTSGRPKAIGLSFGTVARKLLVSPMPESTGRRFRPGRTRAAHKPTCLSVAVRRLWCSRPRQHRTHPRRGGPTAELHSRP